MGYLITGFNGLSKTGPVLSGDQQHTIREQQRRATTTVIIFTGVYLMFCMPVFIILVVFISRIYKQFVRLSNNYFSTFATSTNDIKPNSDLIFNKFMFW